MPHTYSTPAHSWPHCHSLRLILNSPLYLSCMPFVLSGAFIHRRSHLLLRLISTWPLQVRTILSVLISILSCLSRWNLHTTISYQRKPARFIRGTAGCFCENNTTADGVVGIGAPSSTAKCVFLRLRGLTKHNCLYSYHHFKLVLLLSWKVWSFHTSWLLCWLKFIH